MAKKNLQLVLGGMIASGMVGLAGMRAFESRRLARIRHSLEAGNGKGNFSEGLVHHLPEPVQRYFRHALTPGAPLYSRVSLKMSGRIQAGQNAEWMPFKATQIIAPRRGFIWKARAWKGPVFLEVIDDYERGAGRMRVALLGLLPILNSTGPDLSHSALGRLIAESVLVPSSLLPQGGPTWEAEDDRCIKATVTADGEVTALNLTINDEGGLQQVSLQRYGFQHDSREWAYIPYGMEVDEETTFAGYTIPSKFRGGWWYGTERYSESIQFTIDDAVFK